MGPSQKFQNAGNLSLLVPGVWSERMADEEKKIPLFSSVLFPAN